MMEYRTCWLERLAMVVLAHTSLEVSSHSPVLFLISGVDFHWRDIHGDLFGLYYSLCN